jgi:hypothetical protein
MFQCEPVKEVPSPFYCKRLVCDNMIYTRPLRLVSARPSVAISDAEKDDQMVR